MGTDSLRRPAADVEPTAGRRVRCLMASESFGCHGITRSRQGGFLERDCRCSFCRQRAWSFGWCLACTARGPGATGQGLGVLHEARGLEQYSQPLVSTSLPPWSGLTRKGSGRSRYWVSVTGTLRRGRMRPGGVRTCREDPGPGYASGPVSTQRTSVSPPSMSPAGIPRNSAVLARLVGACAVLMSAPWAPAPARPFSSARRRIQDDQPYRGFPPERVSQVT